MPFGGKRHKTTRNGPRGLTQLSAPRRPVRFLLQVLGLFGALSEFRQR